MNDDHPDQSPWDDDDLDDSGESGSAFDAFGGDPSDPAEDKVSTLLFRVSNPPHSVSVSVFISGQVYRVELSPSVTSMTESQLAEEITVVTALARQKARAAQHAMVVEIMGDLGHDAGVTTGFLRQDLGLPSPDDFKAAAAKVFAGRYPDDD